MILKVLIFCGILLNLILFQQFETIHAGQSADTSQATFAVR